jgi:hypothetical protein
MQRKYIRQHILQAQLQAEAIQEAVLYWFPVGFAFIGFLLHVFPKLTLPSY